MMFTYRLAVRLWCATAVAAFAASTALAAPNSDASRGPGQDTSSAIVQLNAEPLATYSRTQPTQGRKIDFNSNTVKSYRAQLSAMRNDYKAWLRANAPQAKVTGED